MTTRRSLLAFAPALPLAVAAPAVAVAADPDAILLAAAARHEALYLEAEAVSSALDKAVRAAWDARPTPPEILRVRHDDWHAGQQQVGLLFRPSEVDDWRRGIADPSRFGLSSAALARYLTRGVEVVAASDAWRAGCAASDAAHGLAELHTKSSHIDEALCAAEETLLSIPARTLAGLRAKARLVARALPDESSGAYSDQLVRVLLADLLGEGASATEHR